MKSERQLLPQRFVEQINLDDSTKSEKRHVQDLSAVASAGGSRCNIAKDTVRRATAVRIVIQDESCACRRCKRRTDSDYCCKKSHHLSSIRRSMEIKVVVSQRLPNPRALRLLHHLCRSRCARPAPDQCTPSSTASMHNNGLCMCTWIVPPSCELEPRIHRRNDSQIHSVAAITWAAICTERKT